MTDKRKTFAILAVFALLILGLSLIYFFGSGTNKKSEEAKNAPVFSCKGCNVILISVDSMRADHMSAYGYPRNTTPNFDKFSKNGSLFLNYFSASFLTPVSEAAVQTGMYPTSNGVTNFDTELSKNAQTISQYLIQDDYQTSAVLSSPEFEVNRALKASFSRGFDRYKYSNLFFMFTNDAGVSRQYPSSTTLEAEFNTFGNKKFFLWLAVGGAHWPYGASATNVFAQKDYNGFFKGKNLDWGEFRNIYNNIIYPSKTRLQPADIQYVIDQYDNGVRSFDDFLGEIIDQLKNRNLLNNTILIVESEHGEDLGEHGYFAHYDVLDTQTHTPLFIYVPQIKNLRQLSSLAGSVDVLPTILELLGETVPQNVQGKSLLPILTGKEKDGQRQQIFLERNPLWEEAILQLRDLLKAKGIKVVSGIYKDIAIRTTGWKYILRLSADRMKQISWWQSLTGENFSFPEAELYDLKNDPGETKNVISSNPEVAKSLKGRLDAWYMRIASDSAKTEEKGQLQPYF